jgi:glutaminyl-tRNA synthetase
MMDASAGGKDFLASLNPESLKTVTAYVEPSLAQAAADDKFQFERHGQFGCGITLLREVSLRRKAQAPCVADRLDHTKGKPVFNRVTGLKDRRAK